MNILKLGGNTDYNIGLFDIIKVNNKYFICTYFPNLLTIGLNVV